MGPSGCKGNGKELRIADFGLIVPGMHFLITFAALKKSEY
jgi:hypothetical protein